jgi:hypothetical protein
MAERRSASADQRLLEVAGRLTDRDRLICRLLYEHRVLTTDQVADIGFGTVRKAQQRLATLYGLEVVDRFQLRSWGGASPFHFVLGTAGAAVVAAERGVGVADLAWRRDVAAALGVSQRLGHLTGTNGVFTALIRSARRRPTCSLESWWSERRCAATWGKLVRPDGYGVWVEGESRLPFLLEFDTGSEPLGRLAAKLPGYAKLGRAAKHPTWVLFRFASREREASARRVLVDREVPVATAVIAPGEACDDARWLVLGDWGTRVRLIELGPPEHAIGQGASR